MTVYFDLSELGGAVALLLNPGTQAVYTGTDIHREPAKYRDCEPAKRFAEHDVHFFFDDEPGPSGLYTVPQMEIGAYDSQGGLIAGSPVFTLHYDDDLYYIDRERKCYHITGDLREPGWRDSLVPAEGAEIFASFEEASKKYPILRPKNQEELLEILRRMETP